MLEYEKKILLTSDEYYAILEIFGKNLSAKTQTNYYFDTEDFSMCKKGITCRIRAKDGKFIATIKNHNMINQDCNLEENICVKDKFDSTVFNVLGLKLQGELITNRIIIHRDSFCEIALDRNVYLGYTDFELEIEYYNTNEQKACKVIENIAECLVAIKNSTKIEKFLARVGQGGSKSQRFFQRLKNYK